ncbi:MAG: polysaccharide biosynthesis/export family protein [Dysgonamonadaceae bacterium]|jgi:polysaccharide export outer membrane protein|nr:polysaccharide biosynthesis/export family protein [Dysgonamonadaceae bacterium]
MKIKVRILSYFLFALLLGSCTAWKKVPILQPEGEIKTGVEDIIASYAHESLIRFQPDDALSITVNNATDQSLAGDFNLPLVPSSNAENSSGDIATGMGRQSFMIDSEGYIDFPVLGRIKAAGYTREEFEKYLKERVKEFIPGGDPIITVRFTEGYHIFVMGEVRAPGRYYVNKNHINIIQVLAMAGDMGIYGRRDNVLVMREMPDGSQRKIYLDLTKDDIISSPDFFLHQNDIVYVQPNKAQAQTADISPQISVLVTMGSFLMSIVTFALMMSNR